ncbi:MAG: hypothetical protein IPJ41_11530 [Phycisphaerales bacterium]|nr:hypothetical protein [Phycisphaerales bacterium]
MFAKAVVVIIALGVCACSLLALRQARLRAANELAEARLRIRAIDERVSIVRTEVASRVTPEEIDQMRQELDGELGALVPIARAAQAPDGQPLELVQGDPR